MEKDYSKVINSIFSDIDPRYADENFKGDTERTKKMFRISPFSSLIKDLELKRIRSEIKKLEAAILDSVTMDNWSIEPTTPHYFERKSAYSGAL